MEWRTQQLILDTGLSVILGVLLVAFTGCSWIGRAQTASVTQTTGTQNGQPVDIITVTKTEEQSESKATVDIQSIVSTAMRAATGDMSKQISGLATQIAGLPTPQQDGGIPWAEGGTIATLLAWATRETLARRAQAKRDAEELVKTQKDRDVGWDKALENARRQSDLSNP
jgi:hypothetical protein